MQFSFALLSLAALTAHGLPNMGTSWISMRPTTTVVPSYVADGTTVRTTSMTISTTLPVTFLGESPTVPFTTHIFPPRTEPYTSMMTTPTLLTQYLADGTTVKTTSTLVTTTTPVIIVPVTGAP